jgi:hypothetical protein
LDDSIDNTFVSSVRQKISFDWFVQDQLNGEERTPQAPRHCSRYESLGNTIVQLRGPFGSG